MESDSELCCRIVEQTSDAVILAGSDGKIRLWNPGAEAVFGFTSAEVLGKSLDLIVPENLREAHWKGFHRAIAETHTKYERTALTVPANHKTKKTLYVDLTFNVAKDDSGRIVGAQASARDVTERYLSELALREGALAPGFVSLDLDWKITFVNREAERILGREKEAGLVGRILWEEFPDLIGTPLYEKSYLALADQSPTHFEDYFSSFSCWLEVHAYPLPSGLALYLRNINRAKNVEGELARTEEMLNLLVNQARDYAIIMYDTDGIIRNWNLGAERLYHTHRDEILGNHFSVLSPEDPGASVWPAPAFKQAIARGSFQEETWRLRRDGTRFLADVVTTALRDGRGTLHGFSTVTRDITEKHNVAAERERLLEETREAVSSRDELLSIASHEIKTPLSALGLQLQMLHRMASKRAAAEPGSVPAPFFKTIENSERQARRLAHLLDDLLDVTRIRLGKLNLDLQRTDLSELAREAAEHFTADVGGASAVISTDLEPGVIGEWDPGRLDEIINNLISNAIKYGNGKPIAIRTETDSAAQVARLMVQDQGIGIAEDMLEKIFNRFERAETGTKIQGAGIGLYVVKNLVQAHGGKVSVKSELGKGSTFIAEFPLHRV
jgi:PAS domain S-box-containing protein